MAKVKCTLRGAAVRECSQAPPGPLAEHLQDIAVPHDRAGSISAADPRMWGVLAHPEGRRHGLHRTLGYLKLWDPGTQIQSQVTQNTQVRVPPNPEASHTQSSGAPKNAPTHLPTSLHWFYPGLSALVIPVSQLSSVPAVPVCNSPNSEHQLSHHPIPCTISCSASHFQPLPVPLNHPSSIASAQQG